MEEVEVNLREEAPKFVMKLIYCVCSVVSSLTYLIPRFSFSTPIAYIYMYINPVFKIILKNGGVAEYERILATFYATEDNAGSYGRRNSVLSIERLSRWTFSFGLV